MTELEKSILCGAGIVRVVYVIGPAAVLRSARDFLHCLVIFIAVLLLSAGWSFS